MYTVAGGRPIEPTAVCVLHGPIKFVVKVDEDHVQPMGAFQPAAAFAYLAIIALDIHHLRSELMLRALFKANDDLTAGLPA